MLGVLKPNIGGEIMERRVFLIFGSIVIVLLILNLFIKPSTFVSEISFEKLKDYANELKNKGLYVPAIEAYKNYLKNHQISKRVRANIHYIIAEIYRENLKDFDNALAHYIKIKYIDKNTPLMQNINQKIVECLENSGRYREAQLALESSTLIGSKKAKPTDTIVAKIDSDIITLNDFQQWYDRLPDEIKKKYASHQSKKELLRQYIGEELLYRMAMRKGYQNDPEILKQTFEIKKNLMMQKLLQEELTGKINITPNDLKLYYKANKEKYKNKPFEAVSQQVYNDLMQEKIQEQSQQLLKKMIQANKVEIFDGNL